MRANLYSSNGDTKLGEVYLSSIVSAIRVDHARIFVLNIASLSAGYGDVPQYCETTDVEEVAHSDVRWMK